MAGNLEVDARWAILPAVALTAVVNYLGQVEPAFDEMFYWVYTLHPALSYLDHPPLTAWLIPAVAVPIPQCPEHRRPW